MSEVEIDVVMPVKNREKFVGLAIESILAQSHKNFKLIIVDNGSSDNSVNVIKNYLNDPRVVFYDGSQYGFPQVLNFAIACGNADFIARADSDDWSYPDRLTDSVNFLLENPDVGVVTGSWEECNVQLHSLKVKRAYTNIYESNKCPPFRRFSNATSMIRRHVFDKLGGYDPNFEVSEDYDYWYRMMHSTDYKMAMISSLLVKYRIHQNNQMGDRRRSCYFFCVAQYNAIARERNSEIMVPDKDYNVLCRNLLEFSKKSLRPKLKAKLIGVVNDWQRFGTLTDNELVEIQSRLGISQHDETLIVN